MVAGRSGAGRVGFGRDGRGEVGRRWAGGGYWRRMYSLPSNLFLSALILLSPLLCFGRFSLASCFLSLEASFLLTPLLSGSFLRAAPPLAAFTVAVLLAEHVLLVDVLLRPDAVLFTDAPLFADAALLTEATLLAEAALLTEATLLVEEALL